MDTKVMETIYQKIANTLTTIIPEEWERVYVYAEMREGYKRVFFYYFPKGRKEPIYSLDISDRFLLDEDEYESKEYELYKIFFELRKEFQDQGQEPWNALTFILDDTGKMKIDLVYEDVSQTSPVDKRSFWESKYLGIRSE
ncbi:uncharacterized protein (TIGR01741 family) [Alkalihalobacillus xiaoxiensis]|uniref:Uncharacterized protein (TIGR01741 family) n=1 Tax=Shouchella xiaoxiensis TaxID=766895 RepID=A0ABS2SWE1_9BACI|nr:immunity protein YezG family protein [Shouchella xiaoxiensis]MBM7839115.1 uncharacterized protein (TIGR01741 family) [Shouchella xiaoxiensis]